MKWFVVGSGKGKVALEIPVTLIPGKNTIDLLSLTVGLQVRPFALDSQVLIHCVEISYLLIFQFFQSKYRGQYYYGTH